MIIRSVACAGSRGWWVAAVLALSGLAEADDAAAWQSAQRGREIELPRDHGQHPEMKIEWWYFTGQLDSAEGERRRFGYQLTFFRIGALREPTLKSAWALRDVWMAHFAVTDEAGQRHWQADRLNRAGPGLAGAAAEHLEVWNEDWSAQADAEAGGMRLRAEDRDFGVDLRLASDQIGLVRHGEAGFSQKGATEGNASHYYSLTRLPTTGTVRVGDATWQVRGLTWMDHEYGSSFLEAGQTGWDWFSGQLDDGSGLMLFQLRQRQGPSQMAGTWIGADGSLTSLGAGDFVLQPDRVWKSPATEAEYPVVWRLQIPAQGVQLEVEPMLDAQEMTPALTPGLHYWEGAVFYRGQRNGVPLEGRGYLEMTGYSGRSMAEWFGGGPR